MAPIIKGGLKGVSTRTLKIYAFKYTWKSFRNIDDRKNKRSNGMENWRTSIWVPEEKRVCGSGVFSEASIVKITNV